MRQILFAAVVVLFAAVPSQAAAAPSKCFGHLATIVGAGAIAGTAGDDVIDGSPNDDVIEGKGGNDVICGAAGNDTIADDLQIPPAAPYVVWFSGGDGDDVIHAGWNAAENHIDGGNGDDQIWGAHYWGGQR